MLQHTVLTEHDLQEQQGSENEREKKTLKDPDKGVCSGFSRNFIKRERLTLGFMIMHD